MHFKTIKEVKKCADKFIESYYIFSDGIGGIKL